MIYKIKSCQNKKRSDYLKDNNALSSIKKRALGIFTKYEDESKLLTLDDFETEFRVTTNPEAKNIYNFWNEIIQEMIDAGRTGNARANKETLNSIMLFQQKKPLYFKNVRPEFLYKYEVFLRSRGGTDGGIGVRMRALRALINRAIERKIMKKEDYPFSSYKISKLKGKAVKKAISISQINSIKNLDLSKNPELINSRNYFMFSFYTRGMNFADMMKLEWTAINDDKIYYTRSKTNVNFTIGILAPVKKILDYFHSKHNGTKYIFPILLHNKLNPTQIENRKKKTIKKYNKDLKIIARMCNIDKTLTSYVARHSYASCLKEKGVATDIISESMGHQNIAITQAYLKDFDNSVLDDASAKLLE